VGKRRRRAAKKAKREARKLRGGIMAVWIDEMVKFKPRHMRYFMKRFGTNWPISTGP
jgi:hypothetical protein